MYCIGLFVKMCGMLYLSHIHKTHKSTLVNGANISCNNTIRFIDSLTRENTVNLIIKQ